MLQFDYAPPGCDCGCLCCEDCDACNPYRESEHFDWIAAGMWVIPGHEDQAKQFMADRGHDPNLLHD